MERKLRSVEAWLGGRASAKEARGTQSDEQEGSGGRSRGHGTHVHSDFVSFSSSKLFFHAIR